MPPGFSRGNRARRRRDAVGDSVRGCESHDARVTHKNLQTKTAPETGAVSMSYGAEEGTRTPTPLRVHGPEPCASANSATSAREATELTKNSMGWQLHHSTSPVAAAQFGRSEPSWPQRPVRRV